LTFSLRLTIQVRRRAHLAGGDGAARAGLRPARVELPLQRQRQASGRRVPPAWSMWPSWRGHSWLPSARQATS